MMKLKKYEISDATARRYRRETEDLGFNNIGRAPGFKLQRCSQISFRCRLTALLIAILCASTLYQGRTIDSSYYYPLVYFTSRVQKISDHAESSQLSTLLAMGPPQNTTSPTMVFTSSGLSGETCQCELISVDCLHSVRCLPVDPLQSRKTMVLGIYRRISMRNSANFSGEDSPLGSFPFGKGIQYRMISSWRTWTQDNLLPLRYENTKYKFLNESYYPFCMEHGLVGKNCFFTPNNKREEFDALEMDALRAVGEWSHELQSKISKDLDEYRFKSKQEGKSIHALGHLLAMAHVLRILFNRQPPVREFCEKRRKIYNAEWLNKTQGQYPLRVSLHIRRADACGHEQNSTKYESHASPLDSPAQNSLLRKCYHTAVYMEALQRVQRYINESGYVRPIEVYLSTDHADSVIAEIERDFPDLFTKMSWHVLDYDRELFNYDNFIELSEIGNQAILGESSIADLWLLSHGEVFIGHLGSRFGKIGWLLATARYNRFVPFFSVDGHSFCCEVDEACGTMKEYIHSMENCMTYSHELSGVIQGSDYWEVGSTSRKSAVVAGMA